MKKPQLSKTLNIMFSMFLISIMNYQAWSVDCYTTANETWSCGIPGTSDNLIISHNVTLNGNFTTNGDITIRDDGKLIITGNLTASDNTIIVENGTLNVNGNVVMNNQCVFKVYGFFNTPSSLTVHSGGTFYLKGSAMVDGNITIDAGSTFLIKKDSDLSVGRDFTNNANTTEIDGVLSISEFLFNNSFITGVGEISFGSCSGVGMINDVGYETYCSSSPIILLSSHCSATDEEPPTFTTFPADIISYVAVDQCNMDVSWSTPLVDDNCSIDELMSNYDPGDNFVVGSTDVTYTLSDKAGNDSQNTFTVNVIDTISPNITGLPNRISIDADLNTCGALVTWVEPKATDNCSVVLSSDHNPGDFFPIGVTSVTYAATDPSGNTSERSFEVEVANPNPPVFVSCPPDITVYTSEFDCEVKVSWDEAVAEGCGIDIIQSHAPGDAFTTGIQEVVYTATDISGNTASCRFNVQVLDTIAPVFTFCPTTFEIGSIDADNGTAIITWDEPKVEDLCSAVSIQSTHKSGDSFPFGTTQVTYTATDASGNEAFCTFDVQSGINNPPEVKSQSLTAQAGAATDICLKASDPDGDQISIYTIAGNKNNSTISNVDSAGLCFVYTSMELFEGTDTVLIQVVDDGLPNMYAKAEVVIEVERDHNVIPSSAITPNGDEVNDLWIVENIDFYPENFVQIVDRWGGLIYQNSAYDNVSIVWDGKNTGGRYVSSGTYFFVIDPGQGSNKITGAIEVIE